MVICLDMKGTDPVTKTLNAAGLKAHHDTGGRFLTDESSVVLLTQGSWLKYVL